MSIRGDVLNLFAELQRELGLTYLSSPTTCRSSRISATGIAVAYLGRLSNSTLPSA